MSDSRSPASVPITERGAAVGPRVLFVTRYLPFPATSGDLIYSGQMLSMLAELAGDLVVLYAPNPDVHLDIAISSAPKKLRLLPKLVVSGSIRRYLSSCTPKSANDFESAHNRLVLSILLKDIVPDFVIIDHIGSSWALRPLLAYKRNAAAKPHLIYLTHNEEYTTRLSIARFSRFPFNVAHYLDALRILARDRQMLWASSMLTCITEADKKVYLQRHSVPAIVIPPIYNRDVIAHRRITKQTPRRVIIVSNFLWSAKLLNLRAFLVGASATLLSKGIEIEVVGRMTAENLVRFRKQFPGIRIRGAIKLVEPSLANARIGLLIDQAGGGLKLSTLTYIFNRVPVVALSSALADEALKGQCLISETLEGLTNVIISLIDDIDRLNAQHERAFENLQNFLDPTARLAKLRIATGRILKPGVSPK